VVDKFKGDPERPWVPSQSPSKIGKSGLGHMCVRCRKFTKKGWSLWQNCKV